MVLTKERVVASQSSPSVAPPDTIPRRTMIQLLVAWGVLFPLGIALEPAAAAAQEPAWAVIPGLVLFAAIAATFAGLVQRKPWGVGASFAASSIFALGVFACPATGHHAMGLWWFGEFAAAIALVAISARAYWRRIA